MCPIPQILAYELRAIQLYPRILFAVDSISPSLPSQAGHWAPHPWPWRTWAASIIFQKSEVAPGRNKTIPALDQVRIGLWQVNAHSPRVLIWDGVGWGGIPSLPPHPPHFGLHGRQEGDNWQMEGVWCCNHFGVQRKSVLSMAPHNLTLFPSPVSAAGEVSAYLPQRNSDLPLPRDRLASPQRHFNLGEFQGSPRLSQRCVGSS